MVRRLDGRNRIVFQIRVTISIVTKHGKTEDLLFEINSKGPSRINLHGVEISMDQTKLIRRDKVSLFFAHLEVDDASIAVPSDML